MQNAKNHVSPGYNEIILKTFQAVSKGRKITHRLLAIRAFYITVKVYSVVITIKIQFLTCKRQDKMLLRYKFSFVEMLNA